MYRPFDSIAAVLFDFGGTLDGPGVPWVERFASAYSEAGLDLHCDLLHAAAGYGTRQAYRAPEVAGYGLRATVAFHVARQFEHLGIEDPAAAAVIVGRFVSCTSAALAESRAVLQRLQPRFRLGVVSNFYGNVQRLLVEAGIAPLLTAVIDSTVVGVSKPDPRIFELAVTQLGVAPNRTLYAGDSLEMDVFPAQAAGLRTVLVTRSPAACEASVADAQVSSLDEIERLLCS